MVLGFQKVGKKPGSKFYYLVILLLVSFPRNLGMIGFLFSVRLEKCVTFMYMYIYIFYNFIYVSIFVYIYIYIYIYIYVL